MPICSAAHDGMVVNVKVSLDKLDHLVWGRKEMVANIRFGATQILFRE
jgi:hypothetical protein